MKRSDRRLLAITHCHSVQSRNRSSPMDAYIRAAVERVTGESADAFDWSESLTTAEDLARLVHGDDGERVVDLLFVTDHVNETTGAFDGDLVDLAVENPRVALGCELQTVLEPSGDDGGFREAPEVLVYGGPERVRSRGGSHFGVPEGWLGELHDACRAPGSERAELFRTLDWLREKGIAHALAHPLDGHFLDLSSTLEALRSCRFLEAVNGGFSGDSSRRLQRYAELCHRYRTSGRAVAATRSAGDEATQIPAEEVLEGWQRSLGDPLAGVLPWGGSDAHLGRYDRVTIRYRPPASARAPGMAEFLRDMVETPTQDLLDDRVFEIVGMGNDLLACLGEVLRLIVGNAWRNRTTFRGVRRLARLAVLGPSLGVSKVMRHRRHQESLGRQLDDLLDALEVRITADPTIAPRRQVPEPSSPQ